jgi:uncharacterized OB-fold protein
MPMQPTSTVPRPLPQIDPDHEEWWAGLRRHELLVQGCPRCDTRIFPPQPVCPHCRSLEREWHRIGPQGKVYSWVVVRRPSHPWFAARVPYTVVLVEMEGGVRFVGGIDCDPGVLRDGLPVEAEFEDVDEQVTLLRFRVTG